MGLFSALADWSNGRYEKRVSKMKEQGKCPDCAGRGSHMTPYEHAFMTTYECPGCQGSGLFEDWVK